jgi:hypothetical protein
MKKLLFLFVLAAIAPWAAPALRAEAPPLFSPEPPEPSAAALVETYLPLLAAGQFEHALALNDQRGMRQHLLARRLTELKAKNPELTAADLEQMSAQIQVNDLNPARLQQIMLGVMKEANYIGMTWRIQGYAPAPEDIGGSLVSIEARTADGKEKPILLGIKKLGEQWLVAPAVIEEMVARQPVVRVNPDRKPPAEVAALVDSFWKLWQTGAIDEAYAMYGAAYRSRVPQLEFLQQAQEVLARIGVPTAWSIVNSREIAPLTLGLGVTVQGSAGATPTLLFFKKTGETWILEDSQFRPPSIGNPAPPPPTAAPRSRPDLKTDLKPDFGPTSPTP